MIHEGVVVGPFACNCHILADEETNEAIIIDPGDQPEGIIEVVQHMGVKVKALLHTHCHLDHIGGTRRVKEETGAQILIHEGDRHLYDTLKEQCKGTMRMLGMAVGEGSDPLPVDDTLEDGQEIAFGKYRLKVIHTPGHTPGSVCLSIEDEKARSLFAGDTLFQRSIGRTDLWGGDQAQEIQSIRTRIFTLDPDTIVYPGHGPETRVDLEKQMNPFAGDNA